MRRIAWASLAFFVFTIPWEFALQFGEPIGSIARVAAILTLLLAVPTVLLEGRMRPFGAIQWLALAYLLCSLTTLLWTIDLDASFNKIRAIVQVMLGVWLVWELAETPRDLRRMMLAYVAGAWILVFLTVHSFLSTDAAALNQIRFTAEGLDPNDEANLLVMALPLAGFLLLHPMRWPARLIAIGYFPVGIAGILLTASREGFVAALVALAGCAALLARRHKAVLFALAAAFPPTALALWAALPQGTLLRLATIPEQLQSGDLNQRGNIWILGWQAFQQHPILGNGAGTFVAAAGLASYDTAHNTAISILVNEGLLGLSLALALVFLAFRRVLQLPAPVRLGLLNLLVVCAVTSLVATVEDHRAAWLFAGWVSLAARLTHQDAPALVAAFSARQDELAFVATLSSRTDPQAQPELP